jgi:Tol biopolymer transport system component
VLYVGYANNSWRLFRVALDSPAVAKQFVEDEVATRAPAFSPDGKWVIVTAAQSSVQPEVYVRSYPDPSARVQVSAGGGVGLFWSRDGTRVYYFNGNAMLSASLATTPRLRVISRDTVFKAPPLLLGSGPASARDIAGDGRYLGLVTNRNDRQLVVVPHWLPELNKRMADGNTR